MSCCHRGSSDPEWLWRRLAAIALISPLAWEPPHAAGAALKRGVGGSGEGPHLPFCEHGYGGTRKKKRKKEKRTEMAKSEYETNDREDKSHKISIHKVQCSTR